MAAFHNNTTVLICYLTGHPEDNAASGQILFCDPSADKCVLPRLDRERGEDENATDKKVFHAIDTQRKRCGQHCEFVVVISLPLSCCVLFHLPLGMDAAGNESAVEKLHFGERAKLTDNLEVGGRQKVRSHVCSAEPYITIQDTYRI